MQTVTTIGLDIAKSVFQVHGVDVTGQVIIRRQLKRRYVLAFFEKLQPCLVGIEACASSHHWSRELQALGHTVRLMPPAYVKPYVKRQKNDAADAEAICARRPTKAAYAVETGIVASLNRPGGNVTGVAVLTVELAAKQLEVLHELLGTSAAVALPVNPDTLLTESQTKAARDAARSLGLQLHVLDASTEDQIDAAFEKLVELRAGALLVASTRFSLNSALKSWR